MNAIRSLRTDNRLITIVLLIASACTASDAARVAAVPESTIRETSDLYVETTFGVNHDALTHLYTPDAVFFDPTGEVFAGLMGPPFPGPIVGPERIIEMLKSWSFSQVLFDIRETISVGPHAVYWGRLKLQNGDSDHQPGTPFATILRIDNGRIAARTDFGEYIVSHGLEDHWSENTAATRRVAAATLRAYEAGDLEAQSQLYAPDVVFQHPTAKSQGAPNGQLIHGSKELLRMRQIQYRHRADLSLEILDSFVANRHAAFLGRLRYSSGAEAHVDPREALAVIVLEVRDGKVVRQWEFVDDAAP